MFDFSLNYFEVFAMKPDFEVDLQTLDDAYLQLVKRLHPDRFAAQEPSVQRMAVQAAAQVNSAYQTLKQPLSRAQYLLQLNGINPNDETNTSMDMDFLMQQMSWRERMDELATDNRDAESLAAEFDSEKQQLLQQLAYNAHAQNWQSLLDCTRKLQFIEKISRDLANLHPNEGY